MSNYKPQLFNVPFKILTLTKIFVNGVNKQTYTEGDEIYFCSARSFGGTEKIVNNILTIEDTMIIETYYNPIIKAKDRIKLLDDNSEWEVMVTPENINRENQYLRFKVRRYDG